MRRKYHSMDLVKLRKEIDAAFENLTDYRIREFIAQRRERLRVSDPQGGEASPRVAGPTAGSLKERDTDEGGGTPKQ